jgi:hypothetical protein
VVSSALKSGAFACFDCSADYRVIVSDKRRACVVSKYSDDVPPIREIRMEKSASTGASDVRMKRPRRTELRWQVGRFKLEQTLFPRKPFEHVLT